MPLGDMPQRASSRSRCSKASRLMQVQYAVQRYPDVEERHGSCYQRKEEIWVLWVLYSRSGLCTMESRKNAGSMVDEYDGAIIRTVLDRV
jgi:hypothetical protein